jgi:NTE family protein
VIGPIKERVVADSLKSKLVRNIWRTIGRRNRTDVLAWAFDDWLFKRTLLKDLDAECRWIFNAANLTTGTRFAFERDVVGDYVTGLAETAGTKLRVGQAVAASAAVPGLFAPMKIRGIDFPCGSRGIPTLLDGGAYDNTGLEALDGNRYRDVFTITINAGGVFVTGKYGGLPIIRDLARANSLLYRQSTGLRTRWMVERFKAFEHTPAGQDPPANARQGVLFGLATTVGSKDGHRKMTDEFETFNSDHPEHRTFNGKDLAFVPTVFDRLDPDLVDALIYRGWWLTGATLAQFHPGMTERQAANPPPLAVD